MAARVRRHGASGMNGVPFNRFHFDTHHVYAVMDEDTPIYIGCTGNLARRERELRRLDWWTPNLVMQEVASLLFRLDAYRYENQLIKRHRPLHNVQGKVSLDGQVA